MLGAVQPARPGHSVCGTGKSAVFAFVHRAFAYNERLYFALSRDLCEVVMDASIAIY